VQVVVALVVTPEGLPLAYEMFPGNTADKTTLRGMLELIQKRYGHAERIWVMDRGIPTEVVLAELRQSDAKVSYLVGTPKGRLTKLEKELSEKPWQEVRPQLRVKLLPQAGEVYVLAESGTRTAKERGGISQWPEDYDFLIAVMSFKCSSKTGMDLSPKLFTSASFVSADSALNALIAFLWLLNIPAM
jgi:hypothetical protein